jgi:hypothetical protein
MAPRRAITKAAPAKRTASSIRNGPTATPPGYPPEVRAAFLETLCTRMADGGSVRAVAAELGVKRHTILSWANASPEWRARIHDAREAQGLAYGERCMDLVEQLLADPDPTPEHIARTRLAVDTFKWSASKLYPRIFGERIQVDQRVTQLTVTLVQDGRVTFEQASDA